MRYLLLLVLFSAPAFADHELLLYGFPNKTLICESKDSFISLQLQSHFFGITCVLVATDWQEWPYIYGGNPPVRLFFDTEIKPTVPAYCAFVNQVSSYNGNSSTVLDCR